MLEAMVNKKAFDALSPDLQAIVQACCKAVNATMLAEFAARNHDALDTLVKQHGVQLRRFPDDVLRTLKQATAAVLAEQAKADPLFARVLASYQAFAAKSAAATAISELALLETRRL